MSDRNTEAVQFLKSLNIKTSALGGFDRKATFDAFKQLSDIYEAALGALRTEFMEKEASLQEQRQAFSTQVGEMILQQERDRREILEKARTEANRIIEEAKDAALRQTSQLTSDLKQLREEKSMILSEIGLIRDQLDRVLTEPSVQSTAPCAPSASEQPSDVPDHQPQPEQ